MKKNQSDNTNIIRLSFVVIVLASIILFNQSKQTFVSRQDSGVTRQNCLADDCLLVDNLNYPVGELPESAKEALDEAINDEYKAYSTYDAIIKKFGSIRPFSMIIRAEEQHISALKAIYDKYGLTIPENTLAKKITPPVTIQQACQTGVDAEITNAALYRDKLLPLVTDYVDIVAVFENLMTASQEKHLPAFEKCN